ncbi:hypothetical protein [Dolichospermum circinale]|uniref:hypothetical protein n=1 Tax=Dolichospermum circinale TaxID=109265 RepID=UPI0023305AFF|nr:hypothetical protein [Dolichospermum circinale]MDB9476774.1 hypothetical protein [Dolichospermum circinale CS-537/11]
MISTPNSFLDQKVLELQHRYRGLLAKMRSRRFEGERRTVPTQEFRIERNVWLLETRAALPVSKYREVLEWMTALETVQLRETLRSPSGYEELAGVFGRAQVVSLDRELLWIAERLRLSVSQISMHIQSLSKIEAAVFEERYEDALGILMHDQTKIGVSLWSVQLRLAIEQLSSGLEVQKRYSAEVRKVHKQGLLGFLTYYTSVRNEDPTTITKFFDDVEYRIQDNPHFDHALRLYVSFRLKNELPNNDADLADILRVEQNHSVIDLYETFVAVIQNFFRKEISAERASLILECIKIARIDDFRLAKISSLLEGLPVAKLPRRDTTNADKLFSGEPLNVARSVCMARRTFSADPWHYIYPAFATRKTDFFFDLLVTPKSIIELLGRALNRYSGSYDAWTFAAKLLLNLRGLPLAAGVLEFLAQIRRTNVSQPWQPWLIGLNSPFHGPEDYWWTSANTSKVQVQSLSDLIWNEISQPTNLNHLPAILFRAAGYIIRGKHADAIKELENPQISWPEPLRFLRALFLLHALHVRGERGRVISLIASEGSLGSKNSRLLPVTSALSKYEYMDFQSADHPLAAPIALHLLWTNQEQPATASALRLATGQAVRKCGVNRPSELIAVETEAAKHEIIYFLREVCVPEILDLSRLFRSSQEVLEERRAIYLVLSEIDPKQVDEYIALVNAIDASKLLEVGRRIVDRSRIHVDGEALLRWAVRELSEDYYRYSDLVKVEVSTSQSFMDVIRELEASPGRRNNVTPDNEADAVLISILHRLGDEFLTNPSFGLDFFLSKRIRHQSFIGLIRGPLEFASLITTRESEGSDYRPNYELLEKFRIVSNEDKRKIESSLNVFSAKFDEALIEAKDNFLHLRSAEKSSGMIFLSMNDRLIAVARTVISLSTEFQDFLSTVIPLLWAAIEPSLAQIRELISVELKSQIIAEFDRVRAEVSSIAEADPALLEFDAAMGRVSAEVQLKLDEAANWFVHAETEKHQQLFTLEQMLEIGLENALKMQRGYEPNVTKTTRGNVKLHSPNLLLVHDILFVALGNAYKHSGLNSPKIDVKLVWDAEKSALRVSVASECRQSYRAEKERQATLIRTAIEAELHGPRTRIEGGSGFAKLAAVLNHLGNGSIDFGFQEDGCFHLDVTYGVLFPAREGERDEP